MKRKVKNFEKKTIISELKISCKTTGKQRPKNLNK